MVSVILGPGSTELGRRVAERLGVESIPVELRTFPDGESSLRLGGQVEGEDVVLVQTCYPNQNGRLIELFLILDAAKDLGARSVTTFIPYFPYMRQDRRFRPGEAVSSKTMIKLMEAAGADRLLTFDLHNHEILKWFRIPALEVSAMPAIGEHFKRMGLRNPYVLAPDDGAIHLAEAVAKVLGADFTSLEKHRDTTTGVVETSSKRLEVKGRDILIVDDIISTGSTIVNAAGIAEREGARDIYAACTHALLLGDALAKLRIAGVKEVIGTDCIPGSVGLISVASLAAEALRRWL